MGDQASESRNSEKAGSDDCVVRLRGLPYSAQVKDVAEFLHDCEIKKGMGGIKFTFTEDGRPSGQAYVELCSEADVEKALGHHEGNMGWRYVEVFRALRSQMDWDLRQSDPGSSGGEGVVRLRGLPYGCTEEQIRIFLSGLQISAIVMQRSEEGRETGEAFVRLASIDDVDKALERDKKEIQHRYIEVFRSSQSEVRPIKGGRPTPYSRPGGRGGGFMGYGTVGGGGGDKFGSSGYERSYRGGGGRGRGGGGRGRGFGYGNGGGGGGDGGFYEDPNYFAGPPHGGGYPQSDDSNLISYPVMRQSRGGFGPRGGGSMGQASGGLQSGLRHSVRMRGLPYSANDKEVVDFFLPLPVVKVNIKYDSSGRPSGEAEVFFQSHDEATSAMQKNKHHMGHRYIELFLNSSGGSEPHYGPDHGPQQGSWNGGSNRGGGQGRGYSSYPSQQQPASSQQHMGYQQQQPQYQQQGSGGYVGSGYQGEMDSAGYQPSQGNQHWGSGY